MEWVEDWKKLEREWLNASSKAQRDLLALADAIQKSTYLSDGNWGTLSDATELQERAMTSLWEKAHRHRVKLTQALDGLGEIHSRMKLLLNHLETQISNQTFLEQSERFLSELIQMYEQEFFAKTLIVQNAFECRSHDTIKLYLACWQMQPRIDRDRIDQICAIVTLESATRRK